MFIVCNLDKQIVHKLFDNQSMGTFSFCQDQSSSSPTGVNSALYTIFPSTWLANLTTRPDSRTQQPNPPLYPGLEKLGIRGIQDTRQFVFSETIEAGPEAQRLDRIQSNVYNRQLDKA